MRQVRKPKASFALPNSSFLSGPRTTVRWMEAALWNPQVTLFTFRCPFPPSAIVLWATHGSFEDSPHYISTKIVRTEGMRISQQYTGPKKKKR